jgi:hypothetical protein
MEQGQLPCVKLGQSRPIDRKDLEELVQRHKVNGAGCQPSRN